MNAQAAKALRRLPTVRRRPIPAHRLGLRARIALLVASGLLALIAVFVLLGLSALQTSTDRETRQRVLLAQLTAGHLDSRLTQTSISLKWAAADVAHVLDGSDRADLSAALESTSRRVAAGSSGLLLFDIDGSLVRSSPELLAVSHPSLSAEVVLALRQGQDAVVDWTRGGGSSLVLVVVPVVGRDNAIVALLGATVDFSGSGLGQWLSEMALGKTGKVDVVDSQGRVLTSTSSEGRLGPADHSAYFSGLMAQNAATVASCYDCHATESGTSRQKEIMAFAPLQTAGLGVVLRQSEDEVLEPTRRLQQQVLGLGAVSLLVALFMVWLTTRSVLSPIRSLTASARKLADGHLDERVEVGGSDEVAELGGAIEFMRSRLQHSIEEIKGYNAELNKRVQQRTAELERSRDDLAESRDDMQLLIDRLSILNAIAVALNRSINLETVLREALANALRLASMHKGAIYLVDEQTGELELAAHHGITEDAARLAANLGLSASLCAAAAQRGEPLIVENTARYARGSRSMLRAQKMNFMVRVPFKSGGQLLGTMCLGSHESRSFSKTEMELLVSVGNQIAVAVDKARLYEELQRKEKLRGDLLQKVITAQEEERKRIARELHDETSQALAALAVAVETAAAQAVDGGDVSNSLERMKRLAVSTLEEVHRLVFDLRPTLLDDLGLIAALRWYAETRLGEAGIKVRLEIAGEDRRLGPLIETTLYRVVQEAVNNVVNHSGAQNCTINLTLNPHCLSLTMVDDGWGFDMGELARCSDGKRGLGLMGMQERVELLGGTFSVYSELGQGTRISLRVPLEGDADCDF